MIVDHTYNPLSEFDANIASKRFREDGPVGKVQLGFGVADLQAFYKEMSAKGVKFPMPPAKQDFAGMLAQFTDSAGAHISVGGP